MFAIRNQSQAKKSAENKAARITAPGSNRLPEPNPLWQSLALRSAPIQTKLAISQPDDPYEREADHIADQVMRQRTIQLNVPLPNDSPLALTSTPSIALQRRCNACAEEAEDQKVERKALGGNDPALAIELAIPAGGGQPLDDSTREFMEPRFDENFGEVRLHTDARAAESARAVDALAYTHGRHIVFGAGAFTPHTSGGNTLLAHELAHVVQQRKGRAVNSVQRFHLPHGADPQHQIDETSLIAPTFADLLTTIKAIITDSTVPDAFGDVVNMDLFVKKAGGRSANDKISKKLGSTAAPVAYMLNYRYLFTCRCGLIDMRHFLQLMYISHFFASAFPGSEANQSATKEGREHELTSESESRFGAEDTPTNALGAFTGTRLTGTPMPGPLLNEIETVLRRCGPVDFATLSAASKNIVTHHYGDLVADPVPKKPGDLIPANQNQTALPDILNVPECGGKERSFPFKLDTSDPDRKTISQTAFDSGSSGLTGDSDIRDFVSTQRIEIIKVLPAAEKVRLVKRLFEGWVSDDDIDAIERIYNNSDVAEKAQIRGAINVDDLSSVGQRTRLRVLFA